jgi:hypothetical protein
MLNQIGCPLLTARPNLAVSYAPCTNFSASRFLGGPNMGARGPRSAADLSAFRTHVTLDEANRIDLAALAAVNGGYKESMRRLKRAERSGDVVRVSTPTGERWYWAKRR